MAPSRPLRVGVLDESELVSTGLAGMLRPHAARVELSFHRGELRSTDLDVVLYDPFDGPGTARRLERIASLGPARVLVLTWQPHAGGRRRALAAGAHGYVGKSASTRELLAALEAVVRGEPVPATDEDLDLGAVPEFPGLSQRESEVLVLIGRGLSNQEIAERLYVSVNSVKTYIRQVYAKTGATRRTQAVAWAHQQGWE